MPFKALIKKNEIKKIILNPKSPFLHQDVLE